MAPRTPKHKKKIQATAGAMPRGELLAPLGPRMYRASVSARSRTRWVHMEIATGAGHRRMRGWPQPLQRPGAPRWLTAIRPLERADHLGASHPWSAAGQRFKPQPAPNDAPRGGTALEQNWVVAQAGGDEIDRQAPQSGPTKGEPRGGIPGSKATRGKKAKKNHKDDTGRVDNK